MKSSKKFNRRDMLKLMALTSQGVFCNKQYVGLGLITSNLVNSVFASTTNEVARNLVTFQMSGAPARWMWEPLNPHDPSNLIVGNRNVVNRFTGSTEVSGMEYVTAPINGINMPWLWHQELPSTSSPRMMSDLMDNMLMIRGINVVNPDHTGALEKQFRPGGIQHTITSVSGDVNSHPIPFVGLQTSPNPYSSKFSKAGVSSLSTANNWLENLLRPFIVNAPNFNTKINQQDSLLANLNQVVSGLLAEISDAFTTPGSAQRDALTLIKRNFGNIANEFTSRRTKYRNLLEVATAPLPNVNQPLSTFVGINDLPIMINGSDLRLALQAARGTTYITWMAEQFAVIEYSLVNGITSSLAAGLRALPGQNFDEHEESPLRSVYYNALWNRGFSACLLELIDVLKQNNIWDKTVVTIASEFGRNPKGSSDGSDHAPSATSMTYFSGSLKGNEVVGHTRNSTSTTYPGTWGVGANNESIGFLSLGHIASTTASLLNVASPATSSPSLVRNENGVFVSRVPASKLVA